VILIRHIPLYWGWETDPVDRSLFTRATLNEVLPPYRQSAGAIRVRVSHKHWLHLGVFYYDKTVGRYGLDALPEDIREWRGPRVSVEEEAEAGSADAEQV
jgi:hypothetical protein